MASDASGENSAPVPTPNSDMGRISCHSGASGSIAMASRNTEIETSRNPVATTHLAAMRSESRPANGATMPESSEPGSPTSAACSGLRPRTSCRKSVSGKKMPVSPKVTAAPATLDSEKLRLWNKRQRQQRVGLEVALPEHEPGEHHDARTDDASTP